MRLLDQLVPGPDLGRLGLVVIMQITAVILTAELVARTILARRAAMRDRLWLCALVCILLGPVVVVLLDRAGLGLAIVPWNESAAIATVRVVDQRPEVSRDIDDDSGWRGATGRGAEAGIHHDQSNAAGEGSHLPIRTGANTSDAGTDAEQERQIERRLPKVADAAQSARKISRLEKFGP